MDLGYHVVSEGVQNIVLNLQGVIRVELAGPVVPELVLNTFMKKLAKAINFSISLRGTSPRRDASFPTNVVAEGVPT